MNDYEAYYIPAALDEPDRWLFFTPDEAFILIGSVLCGIIFDFMLLGIVGAIAGVYAIKRLKGSDQPNWAICAAYWFLPSLLRLRATPPSHLRFLVG